MLFQHKSELCLCGSPGPVQGNPEAMPQQLLHSMPQFSECWEFGPCLSQA